MAVLSATSGTLIDITKSSPVGDTVNMMSQQNDILLDMYFKEANCGTSEKVNLMVGLPSVYFTRINQPVPSSKASTAEVRIDTAMLEGWSVLDKRLYDLEGGEEYVNVGGVQVYKGDQYRAQQDLGFLSQMNNTMAETLFYGNSSLSPEEFTGFATQYSSLSATNGVNILNAGGASSDNTSIWMVSWGQNTCYGIYPKGTMGGFSQRNLGLCQPQTVTGATTTGELEQYKTHYSWGCGLAVKDWRSVVRIANIDVSDLQSLSGTQALTASTNILRLMSNALHKPVQSSLIGSRVVFYMNSTVYAALTQMGMDKSANAVAFQPATTQFGTAPRWGTFLGYPIRRCDALLNTESVVS